MITPNDLSGVNFAAIGGFEGLCGWGLGALTILL